jgi:Uma2 family endonuclease
MYQPLPNPKTLPTMYDLPSEVVGEPGLPDLFHPLQAELLTETCQSPCYPPDRLYTARDLNLYYDWRNTQLYKRPDWFMALGVPSSPRQQDLRWSYVIWQESIPPFLVVELLSPSTQAEDLGQVPKRFDRPSGKWEVYERFLQIPYSAVYDRYENNFRVFQLKAGQYQELELENARLWLEPIQLGLGVWHGPYHNISGLWLRWYDAQGQWIPTGEEWAEQERARANQERLRAEQEQQRAEEERLRAEHERHGPRKSGYGLSRNNNGLTRLSKSISSY